MLALSVGAPLLVGIIVEPFASRGSARPWAGVDVEAAAPIFLLCHVALRFLNVGFGLLDDLVFISSGGIALGAAGMSERLLQMFTSVERG